MFVELTCFQTDDAVSIPVEHIQYFKVMNHETTYISFSCPTMTMNTSLHVTEPIQECKAQYAKARIALSQALKDPQG